jgi:Cys-tRNA(Pro)/Cys-tRNA(Cys) deacylase
MNNEKTNVMRILDQKKIKYEAKYYEYDSDFSGVHVAQALNEDPKAIYKTLVIKSKTKFYVVVINILDEIDLKKCAKILNEKSVEMIHVKELEEVTGGYVRGGTSPIGMKKLYRTLISDTINDIDNLYISGGKRGTQVYLNKLDLIKLCNALVCDVRVKNEQI